MRAVKINGRLSLVSHLPGTHVPIPATTTVVQIFPTLLKFFEEDKSFEIPLQVIGPVAKFTIQLDLERGCILVWGESKKGYFRYRIQKRGVGVEKEPKNFPLGLSQEKPLTLPLPKERLSLGCHAKWRGKSLREIFPVWHRLGLMTPKAPINFEGTASLMRFLNTPEDFYTLYQAGFLGLMAPSLEDRYHLGLNVESGIGNPFQLLTYPTQKIRELFFKQEEHLLHFLPHLFQEFHAGRMINIDLPDIGLCHFEWSRHQIRRIIISSKASKEVLLKLQKGFKKFRVNYLNTHPLAKPIHLSKGECYHLDRFER